MRRKDDCSLVAVKKDVFDVEAVVQVPYNDLVDIYKSDQFKTDNTAVICLVTQKETGKKMIVGASHLYWNSSFEFIKVA